MKERNIVCNPLIICEKTILADSGLLSIMNILQELHLNITSGEEKQLASEPKITKTPLEIVMYMERKGDIQTDTQLYYSVELLDPLKKKNLENIAGKVDMPRGMSKFYVTHKFENGIPCAVPGTHTFKLTTIDEDGEAVVLSEGSFEIRMFNANGQAIMVR